ncbi:DUF445 family protein [Desulfobulbus alkaliphilus]|uniref:DUF445 family protein n=1 Tax=Desulfobulbus alkaliphilus TaxID=869814 RepID=UPI0019623C94|nr:DUF445 family protein [Desulfobulbus alkaliphilus]MBM9536997.1 DUF445 family protein [Desulfobulbus alkaliphilus]
MLFLDPSLLSLVGLPCVGAFIGYATNKIAIRMLFRPLHPWYVFGIRVPMTPGVIPAQRRQLSVNIGEMVGRHLLTSKDIGAAVSEEPFQEHLIALVERHVENICRLELGTLPEIVPGRFKFYFRVGMRSMKLQLGEGIHGYLADASSEAQITALIEQHLDTLGNRTINDLVAAENREVFYLLLEMVLRDVLSNDKTRQWLADFLAAGVRRSAAEGKTMGDILPDDMVVTLRDFIHAQAPVILEHLASKFTEPESRSAMVAGILGGVEHFLDSLGPVGAVARGFFEKETFVRKINAYLDERQDDLVTWLDSPEVQKRLVEALGEHFDRLLTKPLSEVIATIGEERLDALCSVLSGQLLAVVRTEGALQGLNTMVRRGAEELLDGGRRSLDDLAGALFSQNERGRLRTVCVQSSLNLIRSQAAKKMVNSLAASMVDALMAKPVGTLYSFVPHGIRKSISEYIVLSANRLFIGEVPGVVESLNIKRVVTEKVDGLDLLQLERLLLSIMEEQLKYINLFGAMLGFCIGLANLILIRFI